MQNLRSNMVEAHAAAGERAIADLKAAETAPALFKPEWTERAQADLDRAREGMRVWSQ
jgi:hypothetical protein